MERKNTGKKYNEDFKQTIVDLYHSGSSARELSSEYGVSDVTIYKWVKEYTPIGPGEDSMTPREFAAMQKENLRLKLLYKMLDSLTIFKLRMLTRLAG
jgi:transposase